MNSGSAGLAHVLGLLPVTARADFVAQLCADLTATQARVDAALAGNDGDALRRAAHDLAALAGTIRAAEVEDAARAVLDRPASAALDRAEGLRLGALAARLAATVTMPAMAQVR